MRYGCPKISGFGINFVGRVDSGQKCVSLCCEGPGGRPAVALQETGEETIAAFRQMREEALLECMSPDEGRTLTLGCQRCDNYGPGDWKTEYLIRQVVLGVYPSPCQCRCIYCTVQDASEKAPDTINEAGAAEGYQKVFDALEFALRTGLVAPGAEWEVASGELSIHPYRGRIYDLIQDGPATFHTNCFRFDERMAANLGANPRSAISCTIASGTSATWRRIKGFDNFDRVIENLGRYRESGTKHDQIILKYIVLPGINDGQEDFEGIIGLMKSLGTVNLVLAPDLRTKYSQGPEAEEEANRLIASAGRLAAMLYKEKLTCGMFTFSPREREIVAARVVEELQSGQG